MRIGRLILRVSDLDRSVEFWSELVGLEVSDRAGSFAFLDGGGVQLALNQVSDAPKDVSLTEVVLESDDVRASYDDLAARGVPLDVALRPVMSDGSRQLLAAHFRDPDGHLCSVTGWAD